MMRHLLEDGLEDVKERLNHSELMSLFIDLDEVLATGTADPAATEFDAAMKESLSLLVATGRFPITVVSGKSIRELSSRFGVPGLIYAGNHGLEIRGPGVGFVDAVAFSNRCELRNLANGLAMLFGGIRNVKVEHRDLTTTVDYRDVDDIYVPVIQDVVGMAATRHKSSVMLRTGKKVYEICPKTHWDKGALVTWINGKKRIDGRSSVYIGDESADESAFEAIPDGITVRVGKSKKTAARYGLRQPREVVEFFQWLNHCRAEVQQQAYAS